MARFGRVFNQDYVSVLVIGPEQIEDIGQGQICCNNKKCKITNNRDH